MFFRSPFFKGKRQVRLSPHASLFINTLSRSVSLYPSKYRGEEREASILKSRGCWFRRGGNPTLPKTSILVSLAILKVFLGRCWRRIYHFSWWGDKMGGDGFSLLGATVLWNVIITTNFEIINLALGRVDGC